MSNERYIGMNAETGEDVTDDDHINQSIADILNTPVGTRVMRRAYGSQVTGIIDSPQGQVTDMRLMSAIYVALLLWEPRISVTSITIENTGAGKGKAQIAGYRVDTNAPFSSLISLRG
ncbi:baseplate assembly protein [Salmonella enterica]|nr:baseplate assembly protein [Salmonella enterica]EEA2271405.1 baseplate assembly protein [Salmonella enterica]EFV5114810.1 baseplate assembly protein [Salmonella enterica]EGB7057510.1 baseplate assembly protein [Salmonella enterica]EKL9523966.1 GPW/gp25 family protein [Salmonella enterica]